MDGIVLYRDVYEQSNSLILFVNSKIKVADKGFLRDWEVPAGVYNLSWATRIILKEDYENGLLEESGLRHRDRRT